MIPPKPSARTLSFGPFEFDVEARQLSKRGLRLKLQPQPAQILALLIRNSGRVVSREEIRREVWGEGVFVDFEHSLNSAMKKIREVLGDTAENPRYIETLPKLGYRFLFPVEAPHPQSGPVVVPISTAPAARSERRGWPRTVYVALGCGLVLLAAAVWIALRPASRIGDPVRFSIALPPNLSFDQVGITGSPLSFSPDGSEIAVVAREGGVVRLYRRKLSEDVFHAVPGTEGGRSPRYSADGRWLYFIQGMRRLNRIPVFGGGADTLLTAELRYFGLAPSADGSLFFSDCGFGVRRLRNDEKVEEVTNIASDPTSEGGMDLENSFPELLPAGDAVLFTAWTSMEFSKVVAVDLKTRRRATLSRPGTNPRYLPRTGHLVYAWNNDLYSVPLDAAKLAPRGAPTVAIHGVSQDVGSGAAHYTVSSNGSLAYIPGGLTTAQSSRPVWVDLKGKVLPDALPDRMGASRISPDGSRIAFAAPAGEEGGVAIWVRDLKTGVERRLTDHRGNEFWVVWSADGNEIILNSNRHRGGKVNLYRIRADGSGGLTRLTENTRHEIPLDVSRDGRFLFYQVLGVPGRKSDIRLLRLDSPGPPVDFAAGAADESQAAVSPDSRWVAYTTDQFSKTRDVVVRSISGPDKTWQVSRGGGSEPIWSPDGRRIFYRDLSGQKFFSASFSSGGSQPRIGAPRLHFEGGYMPSSTGRLYDLHPDGARFLMVTQPKPAPAGREISVILNWDGTLPRR